jgi:hypothetical protein
MPTILNTEARVNEDGSATLLGIITARDGTGAVQASGRKLIKQADLSAIVCNVYDQADLSTAVVSPTVTISSVIFDTMQADWDGDSRGYNFKLTLAATAFPTGGRTYEVELKFTTTGSTVAWMSFTCHAVKRHAS